MESPFKSIDSLKLSMKHIKIWYTAGMGFFTDAYDLFVIGIIINMIINAYKYAGITIPGFTEYLVGKDAVFWTGLLASSALWSAIVGQLVFGAIGDLMGRKKVYGIEASILSLGALLSAFSPNLIWLIIFRTIMGVGIGGDYPISSTIMSEYANVKDRGKLVSLVFANQGLGSIAAVVAGILASLMLPPWIAWRVIAGLGAIPALTVIYLRRKVPETPRYSLLIKGDIDNAVSAARFLGTKLDMTKPVKSAKMGIKEFLSNYWALLVGTTIPWFILDIAFYGTGIYSGPIVTSIFGSPFVSTSLTLSQFEADMARYTFLAGIPYLVGFPGYFTAVALADKMGRKLMQVQGFTMMAIIYFIVSLVITQVGKSIILLTAPSLGLGIYVLSFFFINFGPNTTTFVIPAEVYPTRYRTTGHGISAAAGKLGAAITTYLFPTLTLTIGYKGILEMLAIVSIIGAVITYLFVKEPKGLPLEEVSGEKIITVDVTQKS
ncbi:MAG: MFS transporter [Sulfolobaceae archaeon]|nr:MFS transporter [Sulfolobaceae archaeon]